MAITTTTADPDFGTDFACVDDIDKALSMVSGRTCLANAIARRLSTPQGFLAQYWDDDPDYGFDLRGLQLADLNDADLPGYESTIKAQIERDQRVESATASLSLNRETNTLTASVHADTADGPFDLVLGISDIGVDLLSVDGNPVAASPIEVTIVGEAGPRGPTGPQGPSGGSGGASAMIVVADPGEFLSDSATSAEEVIYQQNCDFTVFNPGVSLDLSFLALIKATSPATGTFRVRVGGTNGVADGTVRATITTSGTSYSSVQNLPSFTNPGSTQLVKITAQTNTASTGVYIKSSSATFTLT